MMVSDVEALLASLIGPPEASRESLAESKHFGSGPLRPPAKAVEYPHHSLARNCARRPRRTAS